MLRFVGLTLFPFRRAPMSPTPRPQVDLGGRTVNARAYCSWYNFKGADQQKKVGNLSGKRRRPAEEEPRGVCRAVPHAYISHTTCQCVGVRVERGLTNPHTLPLLLAGGERNRLHLAKTLKQVGGPSSGLGRAATGDSARTTMPNTVCKTTSCQARVSTLWVTRIIGRVCEGPASLRCLGGNL